MTLPQLPGAILAVYKDHNLQCHFLATASNASRQVNAKVPGSKLVAGREEESSRVVMPSLPEITS